MPAADLYDVDAHGDLVWAVGYWGTVLRSADAGRTWAYQPTPTDETLHAVSFADESHGWAVGAKGTLLRSQDGGLSWKRLAATVEDEFEGERPLDSPLFDVSAVSAREVWAVGDFGIILHTLNGTDWDQVRLPEETFADDDIPDRILNAVYFTDRLHGWVIGEFGTTLRTTDGGQTWLGERSLSGAVGDVYLIDVAADGDGAAVAGGVGGVVIETSDGGASWSAAKVPTSAGLFGAALRGPHSLVVGDRGVIFASRDGGKTWFEPERPRVFNWFRAAVYAGDGRAFIVGENGIVLRSTDAGESWTRSAGEEPPPLEGISVPDPSRSTLPGREDTATDANHP
jgi:photosystem II stability/assembly factor-like uncharacterized protein